MALLDLLTGRNKALEDEEFRVRSAVKTLDKFTGSLEEYNDFKGKSHIIMDTGLPEKFVRLSDTDVLGKLIQEGCTAFVRYVPRDILNELHSIGDYGIPVKVKL